MQMQITLQIACFGQEVSITFDKYFHQIINVLRWGFYHLTTFCSGFDHCDVVIRYSNAIDHFFYDIKVNFYSTKHVCIETINY